MRKQLGNIHPALAVLLEFPRAREKFPTGALDKAVIDFALVILTMAPGQFGLGVEKVNVTWPTVHEERDHRAGTGGKMRRFGFQIKRLGTTRNGRRSGDEPIFGEQPGKGHA